MFLSRNKKIMYTPVNPSFTVQKWGLRGHNYIGRFSWWIEDRTWVVISYEIYEKSIRYTGKSFQCILYLYITKTRLFKYTEFFTTKKWKFSDKKNSDIFLISAQNKDCGYSLEPLRRGGSNEYLQSMFLSRNKKIMYTPVNPSFTV